MTYLHRLSLLVVCAAVISFVPEKVEAQRPPPVTYGDGRRAQATRAELEATLAGIEKVIASPGYSGRLRDGRRREADLIRDRLVEGDLQVGDQIELQVLGEEQFSGKYLVGAGRVLSLPAMPDISLRGVLRSEAQDYLTTHLARQVRDPRVLVLTNIRLTITGAVGNPGFYQVPADIMATDAIMVAAGGFAGTGDPNRTSIRRQGREIWSREAFQQAMIQGMTLDQLNLRAGDEITVGARPTAPLQTILLGVGALSSVAYLVIRLF